MIKSLLLAAAILATATGAQAAVELVTNGNFETTSLTTKGYFQTNNGNGPGTNVTGWGGGAGLTFLDTPGTAAGNIYLAVYGPFSYVSPAGGNFVEADAAPSYAHAITQTIGGLTANQNYTLHFYQAAGQQAGFHGATTERWKVSFGTDSQLSSIYSLPEGGVGAWQSQTMTFTAHATSQLLSFLAVGTPDGQPPISFLDGVSLQAVPEPATWALMMVGLGMVGIAARRRNPASVVA